MKSLSVSCCSSYVVDNKAYFSGLLPRNTKTRGSFMNIIDSSGLRLPIICSKYIYNIGG